MARPAKSSIKPGTRAVKKDALKAQRMAGMRAQANKGKPTTKTVKDENYRYDKSVPSANAMSKGDSLYSSSVKTSAAGVSTKRAAKAFGKGMKDMAKRQEANKKVAKKTGRTYSN